MQTLSYGYKLPETDDKASVVFPALEDNITRLNSHDHDGVNSAPLSGTAIRSSVVAVPSGSWSADLGGGYYSQNVNVPTGLDFDEATIQVKTSTGEVVWPKITRVSSSQITITVSDNTLDLEAFFN